MPARHHGVPPAGRVPDGVRLRVCELGENAVLVGTSERAFPEILAGPLKVLGPRPT
ncbi:hypothetical protein [Streptomyces sp. NBC_00391]|uniref:hypothetical protein n=1 Tax=Streptomyces sp. NBC_00391 TaxID=2903647 RepID=UPI002E1F64C5